MAESTVHLHTPFEDAQAIFTGTLFVSLALILFAQAGLMTGGTAGAARRFAGTA